MIRVVQPTWTEAEYAYLSSLVFAEFTRRMNIAPEWGRDMLPPYELDLPALHRLLDKFAVGMNVVAEGRP